ncbi:hypothetical protein [Marinobacter sp.]|uniref:hypothetical protein n=1 Tax=Marinobacter sp. TaxID=50741 RepID=UPI00384F4846
MLKELWRKATGHPASGEDSGDPDRGVTLAAHMTHTGEFHLQRLLELVSERYDAEFGNTPDEVIRQLIRYASRIQDQDIQRELLLFYLNCSPVIQEYLKSGEVFGDDHFISRKQDSNPDS